MASLSTEALQPKMQSGVGRLNEYRHAVLVQHQGQSRLAVDFGSLSPLLYQGLQGGTGPQAAPAAEAFRPGTETAIGAAWDLVRIGCLSPIRQTCPWTFLLC